MNQLVIGIVITYEYLKVLERQNLKSQVKTALKRQAKSIVIVPSLSFHNWSWPS